ncbi:Six-hairpin glycosidase [Epithele typhae]|uniref:Six-hairpin glycosidase n=1 Tax=Epithele typhae TaxID=378194 RepID=UPI002007C99A|nr:Six-hairpin glycosidase [Epithele typhae]KAH9927154.1 Six-hairpin glycosidase [Epithele typhae]
MRRLLFSLSLTLLAFPSVIARLSVPDDPYTPPNATTGTQASNTSSPNTQWSNLLGNLLYFYDEQRSGNISSSFRVSWRNDSALDDGKDVGVDLTGGFYDAGDYVKYAYPLSFTLMTICWGGLDVGHGYDLAGQTPYLDDILRWGLDWLIKAHPSPHTLYVQVGDGDLDNVYWGGDRQIPTPRPSLQINDTSPGTDAAAQASAAFAACSALYSNRTLTPSATFALSDATYAATLLSHAQDLYAFATNASSGMQVYQHAVPQVGNAYASSDYHDELAIAALFLALSEVPSNSSSNATGNSTAYYADAIHWYQSANLWDELDAASQAVFNWDSKAPGVPLLGAQIASAYPAVVSGSNTTLDFWKNAVEGYFNTFLNTSDSRAHLTDGGLLYFPGDSDEASLNPALNVAMLMMKYVASDITTSQDRYRAFAQGQLDYVLGNNPMSVPYVVGTHPSSPQNPHSALATGYNPPNTSFISIPDDIDGDPATEAYVLYGAVVGGPDAHDLFWDLREDWAQGEPALDYNAPLLALAAHALVAGSGDPYYTRVAADAYAAVRPAGFPCDAAVRTGCSSGGLSRAAAIAMGVVISVVGLTLIAVTAYWVRTAQRHSSKA